MDKHYCLSCQKLTDHNTTSAGLGCIECGYTFEEEYFKGDNTGGKVDHYDPDNDTYFAIRCNKCRNEIEDHTDYAKDDDTGVNLCAFCWEEITGDFHLPLPPTTQRYLDMLEWMHRPVFGGKGNGN